MNAVSYSKIPAVLIFAVLCVGLNAKASEKPELQEKTCSARTLRGDYGFVLQGTLAVPNGSLINGAGLPVRGIALTHFDSRGGLMQLDHVVVNGITPTLEWTAGTGTYTVNDDCTGTATIYSPSNPGGPLNVHFLIVKNGAEIDEVVDGNAVLAVGKRLE